MTPAPPIANERFAAARAAYEQGRAADAVRLLEPMLRLDPRSPMANHLLALCRFALGDLAGAETAIRAAIAADRRRPDLHVVLGEIMQHAGRAPEMEKAMRAALALDRRHPAAAAGLAQLLNVLGRPEEALQVTTPAAAAANSPARVLEVHGSTLKRLDRWPEALECFRRAATSDSVNAKVEYAAMLREMGRDEEAAQVAQQALALGRNHPGAWSMIGRILQDQGRLDEAEAAYRQAVALAPFEFMLHHTLAELLWARTADPELTAAPLVQALRQSATPPLVALRAKLYNRAGRPDAAYAMLADAVRQVPTEPVLLSAVASAAMFAGDVDAAVGYAERSVAVNGGAAVAQTLLAETCLAAGQGDRAAAILDELLKAQPQDQKLLALLWIARRLTHDPRYHELYDYETMVGVYELPTPKGWSNLPAYLADLAAVLKGLHVMRSDPLDQSLRNGTQTEQNLALSTDPVVAAFFETVMTPIREHAEKLGRGRDPLRARNAAKQLIKAGWSAKLQPGGFHANHLHPQGWLSSAFYVELPGAVDRDDGRREGWLKMGEPGLVTRPALQPEHYVKPAPGRLVLFPSYMWHGTVPFSGEESRLTVAFDVVPGR